MEFSINDPLPIKLTDRHILETEKKNKKAKSRKLKIKHNSNTDSGLSRADDGRSQGVTTEEEGENNKNIVIKKNEVEKVQNAQKNIKFWFD